MVLALAVLGILLGGAAALIGLALRTQGLNLADPGRVSFGVQSMLSGIGLATVSCVAGVVLR